MSREEDIAFLSGVPYFHGLSHADLLAIQERCSQRSLDLDELLLLEGQPAQALYVVRSGSVRVFKTAPDGHREQVLVVLGPGETFNDVPVFDGGPNPASVQAAEPDTAVVIVPATVVRHLLATNPHVALNAIRILAGRLRHLTMLVGELSFRTSTQRVAKLLLEESLRTGGAVTLSQQSMATRVGTAREVVNRALRLLEQRGAITRERDHTIRVHLPALRAFLEQSPDHQR